MKDNVYEEYQQTIHYSNRTGVRAICSDCHVPKEWFAKMRRKMRASIHELPHWAMGTIDTPEKFDERRLHLAKRVWSDMQGSNSRECRNCHELEHMDLEIQGRTASRKHTIERLIERGETCIDCHQGIAHELPEGWEDEFD
jgi:nitrate/TMAO reductase-like tetraheme cytochrome c subunit